LKGKKTGVLLVNLGTPDSTSTADVRAYLREFLSDKRVIDIPAVARWLLLNLFILPFRPRKSAEAYKKIWMAEGSPLLVHTKNLTEKVAGLLSAKEERASVKYAMRYGRPSIQSALEEFDREGVSRIVVFLLFPQYSTAARGSASVEIFRAASHFWNTPDLIILEEFYNHPGYIESFAKIASAEMAGFEKKTGEKVDHVLFSYHGVPERQIRKSDTSGDCLTDGCCVSGGKSYCYRSQCFETSRLLARSLGLKDNTWSNSFQSRLGRTVWIAPYTDVVIKELPAKGVKNLLIFSPAFACDCLETLEELDIRAREDFLAAGGKNFIFIPSLNGHPYWAEQVAGMISPYLMSH